MFVEPCVINGLICEASQLVCVLLTSFLICLGVKLFDLKKLDPFFTFKRFIGLFLILYSVRVLLMIYFPLIYPHIKSPY